MAQQQLAGKVAIVTGAASGIGRAAAVTLATEGARVLVADRNAEGASAACEAIAAAGGTARAFIADLCEAGAPARMATAAKTEFGRIDILVNSAGIYPSTPALAITPEQWDSVYDLNVRALFFCCQAVAREMVRVKIPGSIINISSGAAFVARPGVAHYCSSKAAVNMITKELAIEWAEHGIRVNAVAPGLIATPGVDQVLVTPEARREHEEKIRLIPLGRTATPEEMAPVIVFLASDGAGYVTGSVYSADGGYTAGQTFRGAYTPVMPSLEG
jgi:NAD(P)-dependent dehydrogenase (short-subunit alcohol dehydrogenase family)